MEELINELTKMNRYSENINIIRNKDGVTVARTDCGILKAFDNLEFCREIENYKILNDLGIPTLKVLANTENAILLEDVQKSAKYRLGIEQDLNNIKVAQNLAKWYRKLHDLGRQFMDENKHNKLFYDENDFVTLDNIKEIKTKSNTEALSVWQLVENNFEIIKSKIDNIPRTLTYNDFYFTNLVVAKDESEAFMFDYNLLGKGLAYGDVMNVCASLSKSAQDAFLLEYGQIDKREIVIFNFATTIITLHLAYQRKTFPNWANEILDSLHTNFYDKVISILNL